MTNSAAAPSNMIATTFLLLTGGPGAAVMVNALSPPAGGRANKIGGGRLFSTVECSSPATTTSYSSPPPQESLMDFLESSSAASAHAAFGTAPEHDRRRRRPQPASSVDGSNVLPPPLSILMSSMSALESGFDVRGLYVHHKANGDTLPDVARAVERRFDVTGGIRGGDGRFGSGGASSAAALTPFAAHCMGASFANMVRRRNPNNDDGAPIVICLGRDSRPSGERLADSFARGAEGGLGWMFDFLGIGRGGDTGGFDIGGGDESGRVDVHYTELASTPAMRDFCGSKKCDAAVMITGSHLPDDQNGFKFFTSQGNGGGGFTRSDIRELIDGAKAECRKWYELGLMPPSSLKRGVFCSKKVDHMPHYQRTLRRTLLREAAGEEEEDSADNARPQRPLAGLKIIVNAGSGSGLFVVPVLASLGADVSDSLHVAPDGTFPKSIGAPNPENDAMIRETVAACEACAADAGIVFDADANRAGLILPHRSGDAETGMAWTGAKIAVGPAIDILRSLKSACGK